MNDITQRKLLSALCHASILLSAAIVAAAVPLIVLISTSDPIVRSNAKESINFQVSLFVYAIAAVLIGFLGLLLFMPFIEDSPIHLNLSLEIASLLYGLSLLIMAGSVLFFALLWLASLILPVFAIAQVAKHPSSSYRYPLIFRLF